MIIGLSRVKRDATTQSRRVEERERPEVPIRSVEDIQDSQKWERAYLPPGGMRLVISRIMGCKRMQSPAGRGGRVKTTCCTHTQETASRRTLAPCDPREAWVRCRGRSTDMLDSPWNIHLGPWHLRVESQPASHWAVVAQVALAILEKKNIGRSRQSRREANVQRETSRRRRDQGAPCMTTRGWGRRARKETKQ